MNIYSKSLILNKKDENLNIRFMKYLKDINTICFEINSTNFEIIYFYTTCSIYLINMEFKFIQNITDQSNKGNLIYFF